MSECPLCKSQTNRPFARLESFGYPLSYLQCKNCGFVFQDPDSTQAFDPSFYTETYRKIYQASAEPTAKDLRQQELRAADKLAFLKAEGLNPSRILDIGASSGLLLATLRDGLNAQVLGVEPGDAYRAAAAERGIEMKASVEDLLASRPERFDLVTLMHVLEHLPQPRASLAQILDELLNPQGYILVEVPNFYAHDSYELAHLACYTPSHLRQMLEQAGFEVLEERQHGWPRSKTLPLYLEVLARPASARQKEPVRAEQAVALKRRLGLLRRKIMQRILPRKTWLPLE